MRRIFGNKKIIITLIVVIVIVYAVVSTHRSSQLNLGGQAKAILLNQADLSSVKQMSIDKAIYFTGDLSPKEQTIISSEVDAKVTKVLVEEGQMVKTGQVLALLDTVDLAEAVSQQEAMVAAAKAKYILDKQKLDKQQELYKQGFISKIAYDELETNYQASLQSYKAEEAMLNRSKKQLADTRVLAPFAGVVYQKNVEEGQLAPKNTKLFALANLANMEIKASIPSDAINQVKLGQKVIFKVETDDRTYQGSISRVNQVAEAGTRSYLVYVNFPNQKYNLKAGQFVKGEIVLNSLNNQMVIPCDSIRGDGKATNVLVLDNDKVIQKQIAVILNNQQANQCAVSGLKVGESVVAGNVFTVKAGDLAKVVD